MTIETDWKKNNPNLYSLCKREREEREIEKNLPEIHFQRKKNYPSRKISKTREKEGIKMNYDS